MRKIAFQWLHDILTNLYRRRTATRAEIIEATRLNAGSVSKALRHLAGCGVIQRAGELESKGGRKAELLEINGAAGWLVAVDLGDTRARFALTDLTGDLRCRFEQDIEPDRELPVARIIEGIRTVRRELKGDPPSRLLAVGVSYPGAMDPDGGIHALNLGWDGVPLGELLKKALNCPAFLERDDSASLLAERWLGRGQASGHWLHLDTGSGVGLGIISGGEQVRGFRGMAGEIGHIAAEPDAPDLCRCGRRGCVEAIASSPNIVRQYLEKSGMTRRAGLPVTEVFERARHGDSGAAEVVERAGRALGRGLATATNLLSPEMIILGGDIAEASDLFIPVIERELARHSLAHLIAGLRVTASALGPDIRLRGAAALAFLECMADERIVNRMCSKVHRRRASGQAERELVEA